MTSDFEAGLLQYLRSDVPDLVPEFRIEGMGKSWVANLYSESRKLVIEACSRKVKRTGREGSSIQHIEKFYSMLLKLIDMKARNPDITPVMIWSDLVPASSWDLQLASKWGVYVLSNRKLLFNEIWLRSPDSINQSTLAHLIRKSEDAKPRWAWILSEEARMIERILAERASTPDRLLGELGLEASKSNRDKVRGMLNKLLKQGKIRKLLPGHIDGEGGVYGTNDAQLSLIEGTLFDKYHGEKRRRRLCHYILMVIDGEQGLNAREVTITLQRKWQIRATSAEVGALLGRRPSLKGTIYADHSSRTTRYFLRDWWEKKSQLGNAKKRS
jgi:hypothetical protein